MTIPLGLGLFIIVLMVGFASLLTYVVCVLNTRKMIREEIAKLGPIIPRPGRRVSLAEARKIAMGILAEAEERETRAAKD